MTTKTYTVLEMGVMASDGETEVPMKFTRDDQGNVEITMSGKFKTVELTDDESCVLGNFLLNGLKQTFRGGDA
jgi:hypothetical protein